MSISEPEWGSDAVLQLVRETGTPYIALNPGASYRGLHDSMVNFEPDAGPGMLVCLHEEHAVAIAHGWAKVTGRPMAVALHSNVGLMHASMAIFNAWCDRVPVFIIGATGPNAADRRRPWIDWIHTSSDQPAIVRPFTKWDDSPTSLPATLESLARAWDVCRSEPPGPTYVVLDSAVQEQRVGAEPLRRRRIGTSAPVVPVAPADAVDDAVRLLEEADSVVVLSGRGARSEEAFARRIALVERLGARVVTDLKVGTSFPVSHPAHVGSPGMFLGAEAAEVIRGADAVLALDWIDVDGTIRQAGSTPDQAIVLASLEPMHPGTWSKDHQALPDVTTWLPTSADAAVDQLAAALEAQPSAWVRPEPTEVPADGTGAVAGPADGDRIRLADLSAGLQRASAGRPTTVVRVPLGWDGAFWAFDGPMDYLGSDGGAGVGSGPGMAVGAALALRGSGRIPLAILGDGDTMMGVQALWTAAEQGIPMVVVVANNRSYFNDEIHQERIANERGRDASRRWVGQRIDSPAPDLGAMARAQGLHGIGPVRTVGELAGAIDEALAAYEAGSAVLLDVHVEPGYAPSTAAGLVRE
jgi:thiamine pyrophosphate-dependent acetolactate synthase large subunit-like protein